ncbi:hypothetical protein PIB30_028986 [Stylosanthes scabra]|uniref:Uncharacterized protein n=1 Tax=Stylosanthes scabra TaxID=79078 RepID=A0ABU6VA30_9FABA|nr:hypothetical protein [Stylosanthes scabra]
MLGLGCCCPCMEFLDSAADFCDIRGLKLRIMLLFLLLPWTNGQEFILLHLNGCRLGKLRKLITGTR